MTMWGSLYGRNARRIAEICAAVKSDEKVVIVTDYKKVHIGEAIAAACESLHADVTMTVMAPKKMHNEELSTPVAAAMAEADVIIAPTTFSFAHTLARVGACKKGARVVNLPAYADDTLISGAIDVDYTAVAPSVRKMAELLTKASVAHVYTDLGTDMTLDLKGRDGAALVGMSHSPGEFCTVPDVEARITPMEGKANGVIIVDGAIPLPQINLVREPFKVTVKDGYVVDIQGGAEAQIFADVLRDTNDPLVYNIAELGIGMNPAAKMVGVMTEDEGCLGTVHIAVGTNAAFGGTVRTSLHIDMMFRNAIVELDGVKVLDRGQLLI